VKVAIFHLGFFYSGGGEKLILEEMRGLRALGHEVDCYAPYVNREGCFPDVKEMAEILPLLPPPPPWLPMKDPLWVLLSCLLIPLMALRFRRHDVLFGANQPGAWFALVVGTLLRKPYVVYLAQATRLLHPRQVDLENGIRIREGDHRFLMAMKAMGGRVIDWADRLSVRRSSMVLTNGLHVSHWIKEVYGVDNYSCPAGCHADAAEALDYRSRWSGIVRTGEFRIRKPFILLTNRHYPMKRFEYALWALKAMLRSRRDLRLVITGQETEYTDQLRYLARGLGLERSVLFVGLVSESELASLYRQAAVYVYPSPEEDFGMGIVEAMGSGTPVVAWNNGGPSAIVADRESGYLVEPYDVDIFAQRMLNLVENPSLAEKMGRAAHRRAQDLFSYDRHNQFLELALVGAVQGLPIVAELGARLVSVPTLVEE
jgi:glycosyltransferase involved in cell wall biosynthesis